VTTPFAVTWDYRCPFARIAHKHLIAALRDGADLDVTWLAFSLKQAHAVADDEPDVWGRPHDDSGLLALQTGVAVRDHDPERFLDVHEALFDARHVDGRDLRDPEVIRSVLTDAGADADRIVELVGEGALVDVVRTDHDVAVREHNVWGVPTFIAGDRAVFVRLMELPVDAADARATVDRLLDMVVGWPELNEFKATRIPR
jgi:protein-disulfide isomerase-like protein with CxxC motif